MRPLAGATALTLLLPGVVCAQDMIFSIDWHGPSIGQPDSTGSNFNITEGDVMRPFTGAPVFDAGGAPQIVFNGGQLGLVNFNDCVGQPPGCGLEVDALCDGTAELLLPGTAYSIVFTVDEFSVGGTSNFAPSVFSEFPLGEGAADVFVYGTLGPNPFPVPLPATGQFGTNAGILDGDGSSTTSYIRPGVGIAEPNPPTPGPVDVGDNIDGLDLDYAPLPGRLFFSVDGPLLEPSEGVQGSNTAAAQSGLNARPGDVLISNTGGQAAIWASHTSLGLSAQDDLDALVIRDNGFPGYQPPSQPYDWATIQQPTDMLLFSVRRGSPIIGQIDCLLGIPIMPGDLLMGPCGPDPGTSPGIVVPAEAMGMESSRSGGNDDEMNAVDSSRDGFLDCQPNMIDDGVDICCGTSDDDNMNGVPDECEEPGTRYCFCEQASAPCSNPDVQAGCSNSTGGGGWLEGSGSSSVFMDDLTLTASELPTGQFGVLFMGGSQIQLTFGAGLRCVGGGVFRFGVQNSGSAGEFSRSGVVGHSQQVFQAGGHILLGSSWNFQGWYRDPGGPCPGESFNLTNAVQVTFTQ